MAAGLIGQQRLAALHHRAVQPIHIAAADGETAQASVLADLVDETERTLSDPLDDAQAHLTQILLADAVDSRLEDLSDPRKTAASSAARASALFRSEMSRK